MNDHQRLIDAVRRLLNPYQRELSPEAGDMGLTRAVVKSVDAKARQVRATLSSPRVDRYGEIVLPRAFEATLGEFMANPKFLGGHIYGAPDGSPTSIGYWKDVDISSNSVDGVAQFLPEGDDLADKWWRRFEAGAVKTFSVGFIAKEWEMRSVELDGRQRMIRHFTQADLLEVSAVEIPANPDAMLRSLGRAAAPQSHTNAAGGDVESAVERAIEKHIQKLMGDLDGIREEAYARGLEAGLAAAGSHPHQHEPDAARGILRSLESIAGD